MSNNKKKQTKEATQKTLNTLLDEAKHIFSIEKISNDFLMKNGTNMVWIVVLLIMYIGNRYMCQQKIVKIGQLQKELEDVRFEALSLSSELLGSSRMSQVITLINEKGLPLEKSAEPPFILVEKQ